jgi:type I restriction enzyme R subunit
MIDQSAERQFQNDIIEQMLANGWQLGRPEDYNRELALYSEDVIGFIKDTQDAQWQKFQTLYPNNAEQKLLELVAAQLNKADPNATHRALACANLNPTTP